jgi:hypothetical protein
MRQVGIPRPVPRGGADNALMLRYYHSIVVLLLFCACCLAALCYSPATFLRRLSGVASR